MNRWLLIAVIPVVAVAALNVTSHARQQTPPPSPTTAPADDENSGNARGNRDDRRPPRDENDRGPRDGRGPRDDERGPGGPGTGVPGGRDFGGPGGPGGRGDFGGPGGHDGPGRRPPTMDVMRNYIELVQRYTELSRDPTLASISAIVTAGDLLRSKGNEAAITYFEKLIPEIQADQAVNRAARFQLIELYKAAGQNDKALEQLRLIATSPTVTDLRVDSPTTQP